MGGPFPEDFVEAVRSSGDIVRLISDYVPLKQAGRRLKGLCPFHQEKTPSFSVDPERQLFYCFGCQTGGDAFKFVMLYEKLEFPEALEFLAKRWGVPVPARSRGPRDDARDRLLRMNEEAATRFRSLLRDGAAGARGRAYLEKRDIDEGTSERLGIGYAPDAWEGLRGHLHSKGYSAEEMLRGGVVLARKSGRGQYDRFRDRLIFPIRDVNGRPVAFGGRAIGDAEPKYINSPETPSYTKGDHLYGLDLAREAIRREGLAVVVEGYLDLAALVRAGFEQVVASLGTAFTPAQARLLARYTRRVVFSYDGDSAGAAATRRSLDLLLERGFEVRVVELPTGMDPDDYIRKEGAEAYGRLLRQAPGYLEFLLQREAGARDLNRVEEQVAAVNAVLPHLARLSNAIERGSWVGRLADTLRIDEGLVLQELRAALKSAQTRIRQRPKTPRPPREAEARLVSLLLRSEDERSRWAEELDWSDLENTAVEPIVRLILQLAKEGKPVDHPAVLAALERESDQELLTRIAFRDDPESGPSVEDCLCAFRRRRLQREEREVLRQIGNNQKASGAEDSALEDRKLQRLQELARRRDALA